MELETFYVLLGDRWVAPAAIARRLYNASGICKTTVSAIFFLVGLNYSYSIIFDNVDFETDY
jgi:hypothetical protein